MKLTKNLFEDVVAYIFAEPGAMGAAGSIECLKSNGESFIFFYIRCYYISSPIFICIAL